MRKRWKIARILYNSQLQGQTRSFEQCLARGPAEVAPAEQVQV